MPWDYVIDVERNLVYSRAWGDVSDAEFLDHQHKLAEDPQFRDHFYQLIDLVGVLGTDALTIKGIRELARRHLYGPRSRRAIVASSPISYGLARMFGTYREIEGGEEQLCVFESLEEARAWLSVSPQKG